MEVKTSLDERMQKELLKTPIICSWIIVICGGISLISTIITAILSDLDLILLLASIAFLTMGIVLLISFNKSIKSCQKLNRENVYVFNDEYMEAKTIYHDEVIGTSKLYYSDIFKVKETKSFLFIYLNQQQAYPILKSNVSNLDYLRKLVKKK